MKYSGDAGRPPRDPDAPAVAGFSLARQTAANAVVTTHDRRDGLRHRSPTPIGPPVLPIAGAGVAGAPTYCDYVDDPATTDSTRPTARRRLATPRSRVSRQRERLRRPDHRQRGPGRRPQHSAGTATAGRPATASVPASSTTGRQVDCRPRRRVPGVRLPVPSDEYPEFVNTNYNDAFIAQLDTWSVTVDPTTQTVNAPGQLRRRRRRHDLGRRRRSERDDRRGRARHDVRRRDPPPDRPRAVASDRRTRCT